MKSTRFNLGDWINGFGLPLVVLVGSILILKLLGEIESPNRPEVDNSWAAALQRLPSAEVAPVQSLDATDGILDLSADGEVVPFREIQLATEVAGRITYKSPSCEAGGTVRQGDVLFRIDPTDYKLEIARLEKQKQAEYDAIREIDQQIQNTERLLEVAQQDEDLRAKEVQRLRTLGDFASASELDRAKQAELAATNARVMQENQLALLQRNRSRQETAEQLIDTQLALARVNLERTEIKSPVDGVVFRENAELDSFVQRGAVIVTLEDTSKSEISVNLRMDQLYWVLDQDSDHDTESNLHKYRLPKTPATVEYRMNGRDALYQWHGTLTRYDGVGLDPTSRMVPVQIVVDDPTIRKDQSDSGKTSLQGPDALVRGMFVRVKLHVRPRSKLLVIPNLALRPGNRVVKFEASDEVVQADGDSSDASTQADASFKANLWEPGRLIVMGDVHPIAEITLGDVGDKSKYWICEVRSGELDAEDRVIVSPIGSIAGDGSDAVRVQEVASPQESVASMSKNTTAGKN